MKRKNFGGSLLISLGVSFLVLGIAVSIVSSVQRSVQRSADLGRANQIFFAAESGLEAAFFHHNARAQGVHFAGESIPQLISLPAASAEVVWTINGRSDPVSGLLRDGQKIQIPLFWDNSVNPTQEPPFISGSFDPGHDQAGELSDDFALTFFNDDVLGFDFGTSEDEVVLLDWAVSREHSIDGLQTFVPQLGADDDPCGSGTSFICKSSFLTIGAEIDSSSATAGKILPGETTTTLNNFFGDMSSQKYMISFQSLLPFESENGEDKIEGIPFTLGANNNALLPRESYQVQADVSIGSFSKTITAEVPEKTTIGAFDYIIFD
jgi:hypothetical protein